MNWAKEYSKNINQNIADQIKFGDAKAAVLLTLASTMLSGFVLIAKKSTENLSSLDDPKAIPALACIAIGFFLLRCIWFCLSALSPKTPPAAGSHNSFPDISKFKDKDHYTKEVLGLKEEQIAEHYCWHNWALAKIASSKFSNISLAIGDLKNSIKFIAIYLIIITLLKITGA